MTDWYKRKTWTKSDEEEFFSKLRRARKDSRAQYLKIQAMELVSAQDDRFLDIAETLLQKSLSDYPDGNFNRSGTLGTLGEIYQRRQNTAKAIDYFMQAVDFETIYPNVRTNAYIQLSELVIKLKTIELYDYIEQIITARAPSLSFPLEKYKAFSILAIINAQYGKKEIAMNYAQLAEQNAHAGESGFRYHKDLGLVLENYRYLDERRNNPKRKL